MQLFFFFFLIRLFGKLFAALVHVLLPVTTFVASNRQEKSGMQVCLTEKMEAVAILFK